VSRDKGSKLSRKSARITKVAELTATFSEITIRSYQADPFATPSLDPFARVEIVEKKR